MCQKFRKHKLSFRSISGAPKDSFLLKLNQLTDSKMDLVCQLNTKYTELMRGGLTIQSHEEIYRFEIHEMMIRNSTNHIQVAGLTPGRTYNVTLSLNSIRFDAYVEEKIEVKLPTDCSPEKDCKDFQTQLEFVDNQYRGIGQLVWTRGLRSTNVKSLDLTVEKAIYESYDQRLYYDNNINVTNESKTIIQLKGLRENKKYYAFVKENEHNMHLLFFNTSETCKFFNYTYSLSNNVIA